MEMPKIFLMTLSHLPPATRPGQLGRDVTNAEKMRMRHFLLPHLRRQEKKNKFLKLFICDL